MSYALSVTIGPRFFKKAFNDYADKYWTFWREILQNSIDAGATYITVSLRPTAEGDTWVIVENNGAAMDRDTLVNKLLSLGESGKDFQAGAVGGFGKAKEILYFAHKLYSIRSGLWRVDGSGAGYNIIEIDEPFTGTESSVVWEGDHVERLSWAFEHFVGMCGTGRRVEFYLNGTPVKPKHHPGEVARVLECNEKPWAEVRLTKVVKGLLIVRIGGVPMFHRGIDYKGTVTLELQGKSGDLLTSNRDGLKYEYRDILDQFVRAITVDKATAFVLEKAEYKVIAGKKLGRTLQEEPAPVAVAAGEALVAALVDTPEGMGGAGILVQTLAQTQAPAPSILGHEFIVKNCVRRPVPDQYDPDSLAFSDYSHWLVKAWAGCLLELYELYQIDTRFSIGFIFSEGCIAESEQTSERGQVYYLNPCHVTKKRYSKRFAKKCRHTILAAAAHEFVHGALGESYHGEDFATKLTLVMAQVASHMRRFTRHLG